MKSVTRPNIKRILYTAFLAISIPTLFLLFLLTTYTIRRQIKSDREDIHIQLTQESSNMEKLLQRSEDQLTNLTALGTDFQIFHYSDTKLQKFQYAYNITEILKPLLNQDTCLGGFFLYSTQADYYQPLYKLHYSYPDQKLMKDFITQPEHPARERNCWIPFSLSDRTVLIRMVGYDTSILAVMVDLSLDDSFSLNIPAASDIRLFYASKAGQPYTSALYSENCVFPYAKNYFTKLTYDQKTYQLIRSSIGDYDLQLCQLMPYRGILSHLNLFQKILIIVLCILITSMSLILVYLYKKLIFPIQTLTTTMSEVGKGNLSLRTNEIYDIEELHNLSVTFNQMLDNIQQLKLETYEKKLDLQQARLQYLQLQIRPHFYLNCLKGLFSMAEKKQYGEIQESILALSEYFRYIFKNNRDCVSLTEEIHSVSSYLTLQKLYFGIEPDLIMDISADVTEIQVPPLSILTFVENSIKHRSNLNEIKLQIKAIPAIIDTQHYLNITISDNCGGFPSDTLNVLNHLDKHDFLYKDYNVGIYNVYYRLNLTYNGQGRLAFYNIGQQGCVELFIPLAQKGID